MEKKMVIGDQTYKFSYVVDGDWWYMGYAEFDMFDVGYPTDITLYGKQDWKVIEDFLVYLTQNRTEMQERLAFSNQRLRASFEERYQLNDPDQLYFKLCNIEYVGTELEAQNKVHKYVLSFNAESRKDPDFFTYESWDVAFANESLVEVFNT